MTRSGHNEYPPDWPEIAVAIKEVAGWKCERCSHDHDPAAGFCLTVHHLDMNKANCEAWNLAALCQRCHLHIQHKVVFAQGYLFEHSLWMVPHVEGYLKSLEEVA